MVVFDVRDDLAIGAQPRCQLGHQHAANAHFAGQRRDVGPGRTTCTVQHKVARIIAAFNRNPADCVDHVVVHDGEHPESRLFDGQVQRLCQTRRNGFACGLHVQRQASAHQAIGVQIAQDKVRVGRRGFFATLVIAGRAGFRTCRLRTHLQQTHRVDPADRAATCAKCFDLDHRNADAVSQEVDVLGHVGPPVTGQRDVKRRAAHIDGDDVLQIPRLANIKCGLRGRSGAGVDGIDRLIRHHRTHRQTAIRLEVAHRVFRAEALKIAVNRLDIARKDRGQIGVHHGG